MRIKTSTVKKKKNKTQQHITKKIKKPPIWTVLGLGGLLLLSFFLVWADSQREGIRNTRAATTGWVDNNRTALKKSRWFTTHGYRDCQKQSNGFWPTFQVDCLFREPVGAPSSADQAVAKDPPGLYYKHLLPTDFLHAIPLLLLDINFKKIKSSGIEKELKRAIEQDPSSYANKSVDSLYVGLAGGVGGTTIRSLSLMVHPELERPIANAIGTLQRAKNLYKPYIEGATGTTISDADLKYLYMAALNHCGGAALNNDRSGKGALRIIGAYAVIVQGGDQIATGLVSSSDCNIHIVKLSGTTATLFPSPSVTPVSSIITSKQSLTPTLPVTQTNTGTSGNSIQSLFDSLLAHINAFLRQRN